MTNDKKRPQCGAIIPTDRKEAQRWLTTFKEITDWLDEVKAERTGSQTTTDAYIAEMTKFCRYMQMTPAKLVEKARKAKLEEMASGLEKKTWAEKITLEYFNAGKVAVEAGKEQAKRLYRLA